MKRVNLYLDEESLALLDELSGEYSKSHFVRTAIKNYYNHEETLRAIKETLSSIDGRLKKLEEGSGAIVEPPTEDDGDDDGIDLDEAIDAVLNI